ncbi:SRPBCC family protein [Streptomyces sp. NPDC056527]|uniref:SRPBCC family protein n=1 Tax=Streptomyces sp. NPDC056527 TaxID=3345853 RepID=UPI003674BCBC
MTTRVLKATVPASAADVIERLADGLAFPSYAEDILSVAPTADGDQAWVLAFRGGTAGWVQRTGPAERHAPAGARATGRTGRDGRADVRPSDSADVRPGEGDTTGEQSYRIEFEQVSGDFQHLKGTWTSTDVPGGSEVAFEVSFSTSVPHLAGAIDSAVGHVLLRSAHQVISAVGGPARVTAGGHHLS